MWNSPWFDRVWNPVGPSCIRGCCAHFHKRVGISKLGLYPPRRTVLVGPHDIFMTGVPDCVIRDLFMVIARHPMQNFRVLVEHAHRMEQWFGSWACHTLQQWLSDCGMDWPLPNVHLGVVVWDQDTLEDRVGPLVASPAVSRFIVVPKFRGMIDPTEMTCPSGVYSPEQIRACSICNGVPAICYNGKFNALRGGIDEVILLDDRLDDRSVLWHDELRELCDRYQVATIDLLDSRS